MRSRRRAAAVETVCNSTGFMQAEPNAVTSERPTCGTALGRPRSLRNTRRVPFERSFVCRPGTVTTVDVRLRCRRRNMARPGHAAHRSHHPPDAKQNVCRWHDLQQQVDARLVIDAGSNTLLSFRSSGSGAASDPQARFLGSGPHDVTPRPPPCLMMKLSVGKSLKRSDSELQERDVSRFRDTTRWCERGIAHWLRGHGMTSTTQSFRIRGTTTVRQWRLRASSALRARIQLCSRRIPNSAPALGSGNRARIEPRVLRQTGITPTKSRDQADHALN